MLLFFITNTVNCEILLVSILFNFFPCIMAKLNFQQICFLVLKKLLLLLSQLKVVVVLVETMIVSTLI